MRRALALARATIGLASPNPQVGCVLTQSDEPIGEGAHRYDELDHAEIVALKAARAGGHALSGATAYVTLEPCSHLGRTAPCADALIAAGIARCVVATQDPNPAVSGRGLEKLRAAGVQVELGLLQEEARTINEAFACSITLGRPLVTLKAALSVDGMLAPAPSLRTEIAPVFLTGTEAREEVQQMRHASDAVLTGIGTLLADNPMLTDRTGRERRRPLRKVVLDSNLRMPSTAKILQTAPASVWIFCSDDASKEREVILEQAGARVTRVRSANGEVSLHEVLRHLHEARIISLLLEGGAGLNGAFLQAGLVDRTVMYYTETELGPGAVPFTRDSLSSFALEQRLSEVSKRTVGADVCVSGLLHNPWAPVQGIG